MKTPKLVILRGPSGSGKTTISKILFDSAKRKTALIDQDHYRFIFKPAGGGSKYNGDTIHKMIKSDTLIALNDGYDVILEGILSDRSYGKLLEQIFIDHPKENFMYYFDISFEETLKRHETRKTSSHSFNEVDMKEWYLAAHKSGHKLEQVIPENFSQKETINFIKKTSNF